MDGWDDRSWYDVGQGVGTALELLRTLDHRIGGGGGGITPEEVLAALLPIQQAVDFAKASASWAAH